MPQDSVKSWFAKQFDSRYMKRTEFDRVTSRLERAVERARTEARAAMRMASEDGMGVESLLAAELEIHHEIDAITGAGL
jgi:hypothetical protein